MSTNRCIESTCFLGGRRDSCRKKQVLCLRSNTVKIHFCDRCVCYKKYQSIRLQILDVRIIVCQHKYRRKSWVMMIKTNVIKYVMTKTNRTYWEKIRTMLDCSYYLFLSTAPRLIWQVYIRFDVLCTVHLIALCI